MVFRSLAHWKCFDSVLASATKRLMASWSETRGWKTARFRRRLVSLAKNPSTALIQDAEVGVKWVDVGRAAQQQKLQALPPDHVTLVQKDGQMYYVFPDAANNQAYVGGPKQFEAYKQLRLENQVANDNLEAAQMNQDASMDWGGWGGPGWIGFRG
jgi:hypothetical protein